MSTNHKSQVKSVKNLLGLFGIKKGRKEVKKLEKKQTELFKTLLKEADQYVPITSQTRSLRIVLITDDDKVLPLTEYDSFCVTKESGTVLNGEIALKSKSHDIEGTFEERLYSLLRKDFIRIVPSEEVLEEPVLFAKCVFLNDETQTAHVPVNQSGINAIKKALGLSAVICNNTTFKTSLKTTQDKNAFAFKQTSDLYAMIKEFISEKPSVVVIDEEARATKRKPEVELDQGNEKKLKFTSEVLVIDRNTTEYNVALEWLHNLPEIFI